MFCACLMVMLLRGDLYLYSIELLVIVGVGWFSTCFRYRTKGLIFVVPVVVVVFLVCLFAYYVFVWFVWFVCLFACLFVLLVCLFVC